uniref:NADH dehydrogenase subunit 1 n=1 Tax=Heterorhabditis bacteriophora TaxID=37862 RepID=A0A1I7W981_HETBA
MMYFYDVNKFFGLSLIIRELEMLLL